MTAVSVCRFASTRPGTPASTPYCCKPSWPLAVMATIAAGTLANAAWMLAAPLHWYETVPGVTDFGPYNAHFVRDIGCIYLTAGLALTWALFTSRHRLSLVTLVAVFYG